MTTTTLGGLSAPIFYPSVSSVSKNVWSVIDHVELLVSVNHPQFLVSAFDIYKNQRNKALLAALSRARDQSQVILCDSGIYEVVWGRSNKWCRKRYIKTLRRNGFSHAFDYDSYCLAGSMKQKEPTDLITKSVLGVGYQIGRDVASPIIHCKDIDSYVSTCVGVGQKLRPRLLGIPERELGQGTVEIAKNIRTIRAALNQLDYYQPIHILGTGNPLSMMAYSFAGADSFDGLDWCQTVVDYETGTLHHPLHLDYYKHQSEFGNYPGISFLTRCYLHNLEFYEKWTEVIRASDDEVKKEKELSKYFDGKCQDQIIQILRGDPQQVIEDEALAV